MDTDRNFISGPRTSLEWRTIAIEEGLRFAIREGGRTVGAGVVTAINA